MARTIQVVLKDDLPNVGTSGSLVRVKPGFARNFLVPRGLAAMATKDNVKRIEHEKRVALVRATKRRAEAEQLAEKLAKVVVQLTVQVGDDDKLYGSVTSRDVGDALAAKGFEVDRRKIMMEPIKSLGTHAVSLKIATGVSVDIKVDVAPEKA